VSGAAPRSFDPLGDDVLAALGRIADADLADLVRRRPAWAPVAARRFAVVLAQGGAMHRLDGRTGVKDLDVWSFFAPAPGLPPFPWRRMGRATIPFAGREVRVDLLGRTIPLPDPADPAGAVRDWLREGRTESARRLALKAAVMIAPGLGSVVRRPPR
jgi:hypothetical protein